MSTELYTSFSTGEVVTEDDVDKAIMVELWGAEGIERDWISHPNVKKYIIDHGMHTQAFPSTVIEEIRMASTEVDIICDLDRWEREENGTDKRKS